MKKLIGQIGLALTGVIGITAPISAQSLVPNNVLLTDPDVAAVGISAFASALPLTIFFIVAVSLTVFVVIVLIKALNPMADDQEDKYKEGRKWFRNAGIIIAAPVILFAVIVIFQSVLNITILPDFNSTEFTSQLQSLFDI